MIPLHDGEFLPLPYFPWDRRPHHVAVTQDEAATALFLSEGIVADAAQRLKVHPLRLERTIRRSVYLTRLHAELVSLLNDKVHREILHAFAAADDRRREFAVSKVMNSRQFQDHPLAPNTASSAAVIAPAAGRIVISWETDPDPTPPSGPTLSSFGSSPLDSQHPLVEHHGEEAPNGDDSEA